MTGRVVWAGLSEACRECPGKGGNVLPAKKGQSGQWGHKEPLKPCGSQH